MKFKQIPKEYFVTILDRLTRFEPAFIRYKRVFDDIINKFASDVKVKNMSLEDEICCVEEIFNASVNVNNDFSVNNIISTLEEIYFISNKVSYQYLSARINLSAMIKEIQNFDNLPINVKWIKNVDKYENLKQNRFDKSLLYPVEKILLCEGETERILLPAILKLLNKDFNKTGVLLIASGGKNQVVRKYYSMIEYTKLPIIILLDKDANALKGSIEAKLRSSDTLYLINSGEFEDVIPQKTIIDTINYVHKNDLHCLDNDFNRDLTSVQNIENIYRKYGFGEFKKAQFANFLKEYILKYSKTDDFRDSEIIKIAELF